VLWDTLLHHGYDRPIPLYRCRPFQGHGLNVCEVRVEIHFNPMVPWTGSVVSSKIDDAVEKMGHVALTSLCECSLTTTVDMLIALFLIRDQEDPMWQQRLESMCNLESPLLSVSWVVMAKYARYLFTL
jgi:hypothetical protein